MSDEENKMKKISHNVSYVSFINTVVNTKKMN